MTIHKERYGSRSRKSRRREVDAAEAMLSFAHVNPGNDLEKNNDSSTGELAIAVEDYMKNIVQLRLFHPPPRNFR